MSLDAQQVRELLMRAYTETGHDHALCLSDPVAVRFAELLLGDVEKLKVAASVMAIPLQMALEMGSIDLPGNGVEDLRRGLSLYYEWRNQSQD